MDMMTIILIFLLFSFSAQDQNIRMEKDIELPNSNSEKPFKWAINIMVSQKQLKVEDELVCPLKNGRFVAKKEESGKVVPLFDRLVKLKDVEEYRNVDRDTEEPVVIFHADKKHRFETIYTIMKTAAMAGYPNFRFAVLKK
jgi:biopolymer transport protein ExbD